MKKKLNRVVLSSQTKFTTDFYSVTRVDAVDASVWAQLALRAEMDFPISLLGVKTFVPGGEKYRAIVVSDWGALNCTIFTDDMSKPLLTFAVIDDEQYDISKWEAMVQEYGNVGNFKKPPLPWCATVFHSGFDEDPGTIADWSSKFENDIAWAWILGLIPSVDKFAH